MAETLSILNLL